MSHMMEAFRGRLAVPAIDDGNEAEGFIGAS